VGAVTDIFWAVVSLAVLGVLVSLLIMMGIEDLKSAGRL
jgi:hypothetical protein